MEQLFLGGRTGLLAARSSGPGCLVVVTFVAGGDCSVESLVTSWLCRTQTFRVKVSLSLWDWEMGETS